MERLTYRKYGKAINRNCYDWCATCAGAECLEVQRLLDRLASYEDAEEQGVLVRLPCKVGSHVWRVWITDGRKPEITEHDMSDLLHIVQWIDKFGKTVFLTREEAEAAIGKEG